ERPEEESREAGKQDAGHGLAHTTGVQSAPRPAMTLRVVAARARALHGHPEELDGRRPGRGAAGKPGCARAVPLRRATGDSPVMRLAVSPMPPATRSSSF